VKRQNIVYSTQALDFLLEKKYLFTRALCQNKRSRR